MKKNIYALIILSLITLLACGKGDRGDKGTQYHKEERAKSKTVATIGESDIKLFMVSDYNKMYQLNFQSAEEEYEAKKGFLDSLIKLYVFVEAAYDQRLEKDPEILKVLQESRPDFMRDELFKKRILPYLEVTDDEINRWYDNMDEEVQISLIYVIDSTLADSIYTALKNGADFEALARKYSKHQESAVKGGDVGFRTWISLSEDFQENVFELETDKLVMFKAPLGYNIAKVTERREIEEIEPLENIRELIKARIQELKRSKVQNALYDSIFEAANIKINEETAEFILDKVETLYPDVIGGKPFRKNTFNPDDLAQYERNMILATYVDGEVTLGNYLRQTATWEDMERPPFSEIDQLRKAIFQLKLMDLLLAEARRAKLDETDDFKDATRFFKDQLMAAKMVEIITEERSYVSDEEVISHYQANKDKYVIPQKIHLQEIYLNSEVDADEIYEKLNNGEDFETLAGEYTERPAMKEKKGDLGFIADYNYPTLFQRAERLEIGEYSEPFPVGDGWSIVKPIEVQEVQAKSFEEVARQIKAELEDKKREHAVDRWLAENEDKYPVKVDYDLIWETIDKDSYE